MMTRLIEETGELATVINTRHGDKPGNDSRADLRLEFGDVLFTLICLANTLDIDMEAVLTETMKKYDRSED